MGLYITGMEMPKSGTYEVSIDTSADKTIMSVCARGEGGIGGVICCGVYEIIPVPPHGRLGDLDELEKRFKPVRANASAIITHNSPTIIPAEGYV